MTAGRAATEQLMPGGGPGAVSGAGMPQAKSKKAFSRKRLAASKQR